MKGRGGSAMKPVDEGSDAKSVAPTSMDGTSQKASLDEPGRFRKHISLSAMKAGEGSFRGLFSLSKTTDKSIHNGPSIREVGAAYYLREEIRAAREAVNTLDTAVSGAQSFREKATKLLEEAHRALGRLEQAVAYRDGAPELIVVACEIKCAARRGMTLVDVYGKYSTMVKVMTLFMRSYIHAKFDKQADHLKSLIPPAEVMRGAPPYALPSAGGAAAPAASGASAPMGAASVPTSPGGSAAATSSVPSAVAATSMTTMSSQPPPAPPPPPSSAVTQSLGRSSVSHQAAGQAAPAGPPLLGTMLRPNKHDRVHAMAYVPAAQASSDYVCIWWSAGQMLEFYSEATQSTTGFQIDKQALNVTALGIDEEGNVWTGHAKGLVRVRPKQQWEFMVEDRAFSSSVKAITFDEAGRAWVGDDSGRIKVLGYDPRAGRLETVASLQRSPALLAKMKGALADTTRGLFGKRHCGNSGTSGQASAAAVFANASAAAAAAASAAVGVATAAAAAATAAATQPITAALTGGRDGSPGTSSSASGHTPPVAIEGPVRCIFLRGGRAWTSGGRASGWLQMWDAISFQDLDVYDCCAFGPCHAMTSLRWPAASASAASSYHQPASQHRHTHSDGPSTSAPPDALALTAAAASCSWRLLTGHENGQLLLWHPDHKNLAPLLRIGEPGSPCRGIAAFEAFHLVATGHQNGELHLFMQPTTESGLPPGSDSVSPLSFGTLRPRTLTIQAHKSRVDRMTHSGTSCVTASMLGTIRMWHAADLAAEAHRHGLLTHTASYGSLLGAANGGPGQPSTSSGVPSMQAGAARYPPSSSLGELSSQNPSSLYHQPSNFSPESAKRLVDMQPTASGQYGSPAAGLAGYPSATLAGASTMSTNLSGLLSGSQGSMQQAAVAAVAAGSTGLHRASQGSKDSIEAGAGTVANQSSTNTLAEVGPSSQVMMPGPATGIPHFQTIDAAELSMQKLIGSGAYGKVWLADWTGVQVAVKELFGLHGGRDNGDKEYSALMNEVTLLGSLSHPNIMRFLAMCLDPPLIVMQYYPHGSLFDLLHRAQKGSLKAAKELSWSKRLDMLRDVAAGMQYLHSRKPPVIHGDLRSPNLLLDLTIDHDRPRFHVKIADFGLARMATNANGSVMVSKTTNPRWLAPEVIRNSSVGKAADVYSFAIIMWEMLTWQQPYQDMLSVQVMFSTVTENSRPDVPADSDLPGGPGVSLHLYRQLMERCWHQDATARPSFKEVVEVFQAMQRVETDTAKQQRQQQLAAAGAHQQGRRSRGPSDTGGPAAGGPGNGALAAEASGSGSAPGSGGSNNGGGITAAAAGAAARRAAAAGVASPFSGTALVTTKEPEGQQGRAGPAAADGLAHPHQPYGSVLPLYGMSPILEETASGASPVTAFTVSVPSGAARAAAAAAAAAATAAPSPFSSAVAPVVANVAAVPVRSAPGGEAEPAGASPPRQHQVLPPSAINHHQQPHAPHQHVHFAASAFAQAAAEPPPESFSSPSSPAFGTRSRGTASGRPNPPSSASSAESGAVPALSGGSNIAGAPSTASSSRQSSTSTSGRAIGAAAAAATAAAAAAAMGAAVPGGGGGTGARKPGTVTSAGAQVGRTGGSGTSTPRRDGAPNTGGIPSVSGAAAAAAKAAAARRGGGAAAHIGEAYSVPVSGITSLSPFASLPASQLGELDAAAPQDAMAMTYPHPASAHGIVSPFAPASPKLHGAAVRAAGAAAGAGAVSRAGARSVAGSSAAVASTVSVRGRIPGPSFGPGPPARSGPPSGQPSTARGAGATPHTQPGTPPHRGPAASSVAGRGGAMGGTPVAVSAEVRAPSGRHGSISMAAPTGSGCSTRRSNSGEGPPSGGSRTYTVVSRTASNVAAGSTGEATSVQPVAVSGHQARAPHRQSLSAAHAHVDGVGAEGAHDGAADGGWPAHRRTPSGGSVTGQGGGGAATAAMAVRTRDLMAPPQHLRDATAPSTPTAGSSLPHPRTPTTVARTGAASPRVSAPNGGAPESRAAARRNTPLSASGAGAGGGSPSAPTSGHLSRLGAGAAARPPASPRIYVHGGPGSISAHASSGGTGVGVSRIPSLAHGSTHGSAAPQPAKSSTSRSLDDIILHCMRLHPSTSSALAAPSGAVSPATAAAAARGPFAVAPTAWEEDGLDAVQPSPGVTEECCFRQSTEYPQLDVDPQQDGGVAQRSTEPGGLPFSPPMPPRISISRSGPVTRQAEASWEPPPLLTATVLGGSPFAAAAYRSPFLMAAGDAEAVEGAEDARQGTDGSQDLGSERYVGEGEGASERSANGAEAITSPVALNEAAPQTQPWANGHGAAAWGKEAATTATAGGAGEGAGGRPVYQRAAGAVDSPFAQHTGDQDSWWEDQHHDD